MKIAALTKFKHGAMLEALQAVGWSQSRLAQESGITTGTIGDYINMKRKPNANMLNRIQAAFGKAGHYVDVTEWYPEQFVGFKERIEVIQIRDIDPLALESNTDDRIVYLQDGLDTLSDREQDVVLERQKGVTLSTLSKKYKVERERIRQIENKALKKLRERVGIAAKYDEHGICVSADEEYRNAALKPIPIPEVERLDNLRPKELDLEFTKAIAEGDFKKARTIEIIKTA